MINEKVGTGRLIDNRPVIETSAGATGHAIYGPYRHLEQGRYAVTFALATREAVGAAWRNAVVAVLDVVADAGQTLLAELDVRSGMLSPDQRHFTMEFLIERASVVEFRVFVNGTVPLIIEDLPHHWCLVPGEAIEVSAARNVFPALSEETPLLRSVEPSLRQLHARGAQITTDGDTAVVTLEDVAFHVRTRDDLNLVHELFDENVYDFIVGSRVCAIDIGMNIGLATLRFAAKAFVEEVHSFEPFGSTYARARANIGLNRHIADKISINQFGLGNRDEEIEITGDNGGDSGSANVFSMSGDVKQTIQVRDAAAVLGPIVDTALAAGRKVVLKVDCEGSEFPVFESLGANGVFDRISAIMVEWHVMFAGKSQATLIEPLLRAGFLVFDRSPPFGNGMFYAVKVA